ncbi:DUF3954 domain-containing protein [Oceanobacillus sp. 1P07AA]|uniref:DUF3954 domain-containing protein n=1 Tax=Oceanobacillus sp. 1P07AA TaxID=3132293 RepID=UPI0039A464FD
MKTNNAQINLNEDAIYIVQDGKKTKIIPKYFGTDTIVYQRGKVLDIERSERVRVEGQEKI